jgi:hypothetical protein
MIQLLLILLILVCLIYILLKKEHFTQKIGNLKAVGGNQGIKLTWIKPPNTTKGDEYNKYYIILSSIFDDGKSTKINVHVHKTTNNLIEYYIKGLPNNIIYSVAVIPQANDGNYGTVSTKSKIKTDQHSPLCLSTTKCIEFVFDPHDDSVGAGVGVGVGVGSGAGGCDNKCYNDIKRMIVENRLINVEGNYTINIM